MVIVDKLKGWINQGKSVRMVADDLQLTGELILLVRMMFADGELKPAELDNFKRICKIAFDIPEEDVPEVVEYLQDFGYETNVDDATAVFEGMPWERKKTLLVHLLSIAKADDVIHADEVELIRKVSSLMGLDASEIAKMRS